MISFTIIRKDGRYKGFECKGHADFADEGMDIVCSAVSALTINAVNSIEKLTGAVISVTEAEEGGYLKADLDETSDEKAQLLMESLLLGIRSIEESYGTEFIKTKVV